jgi:hypothetical protein
MSFKENLLKKIKIDELSKKIIATFGPVDSGRRVDKQLVKNLLEMGPYTHLAERDLDLYLLQPEAQPPLILVLDNELKFYRTTIEDVALRKSPTIKEMVSIRNAIKILKDSDVVVSTKEESLKTIQAACIAQLDLTFTEADLEEIALQGVAALENKYAEGVIESLLLFGELLHFVSPPKAMKMRHHMVTGILTANTKGETRFGPMVIFSKIDNTLKLISTQLNPLDKNQIEHFKQVAAGQEIPTLEGADVFTDLKDRILKQNPAEDGL